MEGFLTALQMLRPSKKKKRGGKCLILSTSIWTPEYEAELSAEAEVL